MASLQRLCTPGAMHEGQVEIVEASTADAVLEAFAAAARAGRRLTLVGARRSFGGQAFPVAGGLGLDVSALDRGATILSEEPDGSVWVQAGGGTRFCDLHAQFPGHRVHGAPTTDTITLAGALATCAHNMSGYLADEVRAYTLLTPSGEVLARRAGQGEAFEVGIGALGCLGAMTRIELRLLPIAASQQVLIRALWAGSGRSPAFCDAIEAATDDPQNDAGVGAVVYGVGGHAIVAGEQYRGDARELATRQAPLTDDNHELNALTQGLSNRFPILGRTVISRLYRPGRGLWAPWYGFAFYHRSFDLADTVLRRRRYALARAIGVDPRLPLRHQSWFFPRARLREVMALYWRIMADYPGIEARVEQQDLVLLPPSRWPMHSLGKTEAGVGVLTSSFAVAPGSAIADRVAAFFRAFTAAAAERGELGVRISLCKQLHVDEDVLRASHRDWIEAARRWRARLDPQALLSSRALVALGVSSRE